MPATRRRRRFDPPITLRLGVLRGYRAEIAKLDAEEKRVTRELARLVHASGSTLDQLCGLSTVSVAELLVEVGDPRRFTDGGFARFNGTAPLAASTAEGPGEPVRHRYNPGGNRHRRRVPLPRHVRRHRVVRPTRSDRSAATSTFSAGSSWRRGAGTEPLRWESTAFNVDYQAGTVRFYYDNPEGKRAAWDDPTYVPCQQWDSIGAWFEPYPWGNAAQRQYVGEVQQRLNDREWTSTSFVEWTPPSSPPGITFK